MTTSTDRRLGATIALAALLAALLVTACAGGAAGPINRDEGAGGGAEGRPGAQPAPGPVDGGTDGTGTVVLDAARPELLVIKTGTLDLQVEAVDKAVSAAAGAIEALGGYVSGSEQAGDGENVTATITYRIPADRWEDALAALRALALKVVAEKTGTQEVTGQVVDLRARIANLQATERALQSIMTQATKISDVLAVQAELTKVRGEIEAATAQKQHLEEQAAFSTLTAQFSLRPEPAVIASQKKFDPKTEVDRASASLVEVLQGLATAGIWFGIVWLPILLVLGLVTLVVGVVVRRRLPRRGPDAGPGSQLETTTVPDDRSAPPAGPAATAAEG